jgi:hypothetical protein
MPSFIFKKLSSSVAAQTPSRSPGIKKCKSTQSAVSQNGAPRVEIKTRVCQMVCFQTKTPNLGNFRRALQWKMLVYEMDIWSTLQPFGILYGHLVHFVVV